MVDVASPAAALVDGFGRTIRYLRVSVTDRCDLRCRYCMAEKMTFLPRDKLLALEEIAIIAERFIAHGVRKIRLSGGEPLVRRDVIELAHRLGRHVGSTLDELTMTTNGTRLAEHAEALVAAGMRRVNVSLDSRDSDRFRFITRHGDVAQVLGGIAAAKKAGLAVKINMVALKDFNEDEIAPMLAWCVAEGHDLTLIETMPLGAIDEDRSDRFVPLTTVFAGLAAQFDLTRDMRGTGGPARYWQVAGSTTRLGLISPLTANFCDGCNRVRLTTEGRLYSCLGHDDQVDVKAALRDGGLHGLDVAIAAGIAGKPARHDFRIAPRRRARGVAAHERDRGMTAYPRRALVASPTPPAQTARAELADAWDWCAIEEADLVIALGGDGFLLQTLHTMLDARRMTVPVFGMNLGTVGFLMNEWRRHDLDQRLEQARAFKVIPLLMTATGTDGRVHTIPAINEVSLLRETRQTAKIEVTVNGRIVLEELACDGILAATPAGSTAYNLSAHGPILPLGSALIALTAISAFRPRRWRGAILPDKARIGLRVLEPDKRPVSAVADQREIRDVAQVEIAMDRARELTLLFDPEHALDDRITMEQFIA